MGIEEKRTHKETITTKKYITQISHIIRSLVQREQNLLSNSGVYIVFSIPTTNNTNILVLIFYHQKETNGGHFFNKKKLTPITPR